jgi:hypothetical protein
MYLVFQWIADYIIVVIYAYKFVLQAKSRE